MSTKEQRQHKGAGAGWDGATVLPTAAHRGRFPSVCPGPSQHKLEKPEATPATCSTGPRGQESNHSPPGEQLSRDPGFLPKQPQAHLSPTRSPLPPGSKQQVVFLWVSGAWVIALGSLATIAIICPALERAWLCVSRRQAGCSSHHPPEPSRLSKAIIVRRNLRQSEIKSFKGIKS